MRRFEVPKVTLSTFTSGKPETVAVPEESSAKGKHPVTTPNANERSVHGFSGSIRKSISRSNSPASSSRGSQEASRGNSPEPSNEGRSNVGPRKQISQSDLNTAPKNAANHPEGSNERSTAGGDTAVSVATAPSSDDPAEQQQAAPAHGTNEEFGITDNLWIKAYNKLPDELKQEVGVDKLGSLQKILEMVTQAKEEKEARQWKLNRGDKEINLHETADRLVGWIAKFKEIGDIAVQYDPIHAALPWAGVRFILMLVVGDQEKLAAAIVGMERVTGLIGHCAIYEQLYLTYDIPKSAEAATENLRRELLALYTAILQVLCRLRRVFKGKIVDNLKTSDATLAEIRAIDKPELAVNSAATVIENCYQFVAREHSKDEFNKLRKLLEDFLPVISKIGRNVAKIYKIIERKERTTILEWFSTVPYRDHHDFACEGRVEHTGTWLFQRKEFIDWQNSTTPAILFLHGIPSAGKTKLVSATIQHLEGIAQFDKIAFFYCKRDEGDRRDRHKILLSLIKQLACPAIDIKLPDRDPICAEALEAYNKEQKGPSSRRQLSFDSSLQLLGKLVGCYAHPVIVLDALDECSEEVRGNLLKGLLSVINKVKHPFNILLSSRHSLDIQNHLWGLPHVCIEATDNNEDIANYVQQQLTSRIDDKSLLQGNVSEELRDCIEEVLLRDANGIFLWVDWQLRQLCKFMRESDIRDRLGKLPKGLTGVYDEIMRSINTQPECNQTLATNALKWMLVSKRPLRPAELITAVELDPSSSLSTCNSAATPPTFGVKLIIQSCNRLLLLDERLDVVRFSHLSVQEYLESRDTPWNVDIITAERFVSECCLWVLQIPHSTESPLYKYAAYNWLWHCKSYQDRVLCPAGSTDKQHEMDIPLLNRVLGSFDQASDSYLKWVDWVRVAHGKYTKPKDNLDSVYATPPRPVFAAALAGLGELVKWLWQADGNDMKIRNANKVSLLELACKHGTLWIVTKILRQDFEARDVKKALYIASKRGKLDMVKLILSRWAVVNESKGKYGTALGAAACGGNLEIVTLLLDRGADVNITGGKYGTALGTAAWYGNLEIVTLLLDRGADVNSTGGRYGTALGAAAYNDNLEIVTFLMERSADLYITRGSYGTALGAAAYNGKLEIVTFLLDRGADVNITGGYYGTALSTAAWYGNLEIVTFLLDRGADVNMLGGHYGTALGTATATRYGNLEIVTFLLDRGADVNITGGHYGTVLGAAAYHGNLEIITLLLDRGADVNITGGEYGTALGAAACYGNLEIVTLLLDRGADVNIIEGDYGTALGTAAYRGNLEIVALLMDRGADVNITGGDYGTALGAAAYRGNLGIVTLLMDRGADVNITGGDYGIALGAAAYGGYLEVVTLLLDRGADVNITGGDYGTALGAAAYEGNLEIVTFLLDRGADVNITGGDWGTALGAAAYNSNLEIVTLLLDRGADVNIAGGDYGTALGAAVYNGNPEIVTLLLDRGADINITADTEYGTALGAAAYKGNVWIVSLLLERGANPDLTNNHGARPRDLAEQQGHQKVVELMDSKCVGRNADKS